jgi:nucleotide-binding universal stress UspA family protein
MEYKTIVVHLDDGKHCKARIGVASQLARLFDAHLVGSYAVDPPEPSPLSDTAYPRLRAARITDMEERANAAATLFDAAMRTAGFAAPEFRKGEGGAVDAMTLHARYADLIVIGQTDPDDYQTGVATTFPGLVALSSGRPSLIVPYYAEAFPKLGTNVLVAWNGSREATRAVTDALPLLRRAKQVTVMPVHAKPRRDTHGEMPGSDIALYLARHGVNAEVRQSYADAIGVGDELLARASDMDSDLIVMGAYGHSRLREIVLGGVTQTLMKHMTVPVLMAH